MPGNEVIVIQTAPNKVVVEESGAQVIVMAPGPQGAPGSSGAFGDLSDVTISGIVSGEIIKWNGSAWINQTLAETGIAAASHTHAAADIVSGTVATARLGSGTADGTTFLRGDQTWATPTATVATLDAVGNVTITGIATGEIIKWNGSAWINNTLVEAGIAAAVHTHLEADVTDLQAYLLGITGEPFSDLSDVTITGIATGEIPKWNGSAWINQTLAEAGISATGHTHTESEITDLQAYLLDLTGDALSTLSDVTITTIGTGEILKWTGSAWINNTLAEAGISAVGHVHAATDITTATMATARLGSGTADSARFLRGDSTWATIPQAISELNDVPDVSITGVTTGEVLVWDGVSDWVNNTLAEAGIAAASHNHSAAEITSGTLVAARGGTGQATPTAGSILVGNGAIWAKLAAGAAGTILGVKTAATTPTFNLPEFEKAATFDGGLTSPPAVNSAVQLASMRGGEVSEATVIAMDSAGDRVSDSLTVTVYKVTAGGTETELGTIVLSGASYDHDTALAGWSVTTIAAGDAIKFKLTSAPSTATRVSAAILVNKL